MIEPSSRSVSQEMVDRDCSGGGRVIDWDWRGWGWGRRVRVCAARHRSGTTGEYRCQGWRCMTVGRAQLRVAMGSALDSSDEDEGVC